MSAGTKIPKHKARQMRVKKSKYEVKQPARTAANKLRRERARQRWLARRQSPEVRERMAAARMRRAFAKAPKGHDKFGFGMRYGIRCQVPVYHTPTPPESKPVHIPNFGS